jgi:hypothetical protein
MSDTTTLPLPWLELICLPHQIYDLNDHSNICYHKLFIVLGLSVDINGDVNIEALLTDIEASFTISLWLFAVPVIVIGLIIRKQNP